MKIKYESICTKCWHGWKSLSKPRSLKCPKCGAFGSNNIDVKEIISI